LQRSLGVLGLKALEHIRLSSYPRNPLVGCSTLHTGRIEAMNAYSSDIWDMSMCTLFEYASTSAVARRQHLQWRHLVHGIRVGGFGLVSGSKEHVRDLSSRDALCR